MFVCVSPSDSDGGESLCSLNFAARVRNVELGPAKRKDDAKGKVPPPLPFLLECHAAT